MSGPAWSLGEDQKTIAVNFPTTPPTALKLDAAGIDELLRGIGSLRAHMVPEHSYDDPRGTKREGVVVNPRWAVEQDLMFAHVLLHLRDPRYGMMSFLLPPEEAGRLGQLMVDLAAAPRPGPQSDKAN